jgi:hypothetical protein
MHCTGTLQMLGFYLLTYFLLCYAVVNVGPLTLNLLTTTIVAPPSNASKLQMGFNSAFKVLMEETQEE